MTSKIAAPLAMMNKKLLFYTAEAARTIGTTTPVIQGIPRFVKEQNYCENFGRQWEKFSRTQLDNETFTRLSEERLTRCLGEPLGRLGGKLVLEAGCGSGRFTHLLLKHAHQVVSFDMSKSVEQNAINNTSPNLTIAQADILDLPFKPACFDVVFCLGVLQHTPSTAKSIRCLWQMVKPGGKLVIDHYKFKLRNILPPPIGTAAGVYRFFILKLPNNWQLPAVKAIVSFWFPVHWLVRKNLILDRMLSRLSPVYFYYNNPDISLRCRNELYEHALLDTHDALTDRYKRFIRKPRLLRILKGLNACSICVKEAGNGLEASCVKPIAN